jgi:hypothetical protein
MSDIPEQFNRQVTRHLHEQGLEMTPEEVRQHREEAYRKLRAALRERGYDPPESDMELLAWMKQAGL